MHSTIVVFWIAAASSAVVGVLLTGFMRRYALARAMIDVPNERSSHTVATPRGGGVAIVICYVAIVPVLWRVGYIEGRTMAALLGAVAIAVTGWWDDHADLSPATRLLVQLAAAAWAVAWLRGLPALTLGATTVHVGVWGSILAGIALVWLCNLYNFMDGIDGIAGSEAAVVGAAIALMLWRAGAPGLATVSAVLAASALGFLVWNWPPARVFMGDVGSATLGFAFGVLAIAGERTAGASALVLMLPLGVFIADATFTLARRAIRGERVYAAHRSHVYQRLVQAGWGHERVTSIAGLVTLMVSGLAIVAQREPDAAGVIIAGVALGLVLIGWLLMRIAGRTVHREPAREPELAAVAEASTPVDDDGGDLTVMMRRQG